MGNCSRLLFRRHSTEACFCSYYISTNKRLFPKWWWDAFLKHMKTFVFLNCTQSKTTSGGSKQKWASAPFQTWIRGALQQQLCPDEKNSQHLQIEKKKEVTTPERIVGDQLLKSSMTCLFPKRILQKKLIGWFYAVQVLLLDCFIDRCYWYEIVAL